MEETRITVCGNLTREPEMRFLDNKDAVCRFAVASTPRYRDNATGEWKDGDPLFVECVAWRQLAENIAASNDGGFTKGTRVVVTGVFKQRSYETDAGEKRTVYELTVDEIGASLRYATVAVTKVKSGGGGGRRSGAGDPAWEGASKQRPAAQEAQGAASGGGQAQQAQQRQQPAQAAAGGGGFDDI